MGSGQQRDMATEQRELLAQARALAEQAAHAARETVLVNLHCARRASVALPVATSMTLPSCETDGREARFGVEMALASLRSHSAVLARAYAHMLLHCLLGHVNPPEGVDELRWSVAADAAVGVLLAELDCPAICVPDAARDEQLTVLRSRVEHPTARAFYTLLEREGTDEGELARLELALGMDSHACWFRDGADTQAMSMHERDALQRRWQQLARQAATELSARGAAGDALESSLGELDAAPMSLPELMASLCSPRERVHVNVDEFDYALYAHGLATYGNVPIVEPLEYIEQPRPRDLVIAIDSSGSIGLEQARGFMRLACGLLAAGTGEGTRVHVVQCDERIQDVRVVESAADAAALVENMTLRGRGGTDFRPVFDYALDVLETSKHEQRELAGVVYFTDGKGTFPESAPPFDAAFAFLDEAAPVPGWASTVLVLSAELDARDPDAPSRAERM